MQQQPLPVAARVGVNTLQTLRGETGGAANNRSGFLPLGLRDSVFHAEQAQAAAHSFGRTGRFPERPVRHVPVDTVTTRGLLHADDGIPTALPVEVAGLAPSAKFKGFYRAHVPDPVLLRRDGDARAADARVAATLNVRSARLIKVRGRKEEEELGYGGRWRVLPAIRPLLFTPLVASLTHPTPPALL